MSVMGSSVRYAFRPVSADFFSHALPSPVEQAIEMLSAQSDIDKTQGCSLRLSLQGVVRQSTILDAMRHIQVHFIKWGVLAVNAHQHRSNPITSRVNGGWAVTHVEPSFVDAARFARKF